MNAAHKGVVTALNMQFAGRDPCTSLTGSLSRSCDTHYDFFTRNFASSPFFTYHSVKAYDEGHKQLKPSKASDRVYKGPATHQ